jgi:hypothetical protein
MKARLAATLVVILGIGLGADARAESVTCADGTQSEAGRGACSHHGGVAKREAPRTRDRPTASTESAKRTVRCKDGTLGTVGRGACSHHGGIAEYGESTFPVPTRTDRDTSARRGDTVQRDRPTVERRTNTPWWMPGGDDATGLATARCRDGVLSYARHHRGACSKHGGVAIWLDH